MRSHLVVALLVVSTLYGSSEGCKGCVSLDEYNFDKIISRFKAVLVKFDVAYPYGPNHDTFTVVAEEMASSDDLILAEVGVKDYGDKENEPLALKHGITKEDLPALRLFVHNKLTAEFGKNEEWTVENLRNLIRDHTDIYVGLPGCLERFDRLAADFISSDNKQKKLEEAEKVAEDVEENEKKTASIYVKFMKKIIETGTSFVSTEMGRLNKILTESKISEKKKVELGNRLNILRSFSLPKDEL